MRVFLVGLLALAGIVAAAAAQARDSEYKLRIDEVLQRADFKDKLGGDIRFYFGDAKTPAVARRWASSSPTKRPIPSASPTRRRAAGPCCRR